MAEDTTLYTTDPDTFRRWAKDRDGRPATVKGTGSGEPGILRIDFPGYSGEQDLEGIDWDSWFEKFETQGLALAYQEETKAGEKSNFNKLVDRESVRDRLEARGQTR